MSKITTYNCKFPDSKKETVTSYGVPVFAWFNPQTANNELIQAVPEGSWRLNVSEFNAQQIAYRLADHIQPSLEKIMHNAYTMEIEEENRKREQSRTQITTQGALFKSGPAFDPKDTEEHPVLPPKDINVIKASLKGQVPVYADNSTKDLLEQTIPFIGHTKTADLIVSYLIQRISNIRAVKKNRDSLGTDIDNYAVRIVERLIVTPQWPTTESIAKRIKATLDKSSPYEERIKVGLDTAAQSAVLTLATKTAGVDRKIAKVYTDADYLTLIREMNDIELQINETLARQEQDPSNPQHQDDLDRLIIELGEKKEEISEMKEQLDEKAATFSVEKQKIIDKELNRFDALRRQIRVIQSRVNLAMREQQIQETRQQETQERELDWKASMPFFDIPKKLAAWSDGLIGSKYSHDIRKVRMQMFASRLKNFGSNLFIEYTDNRKDGKNVIQSATKALGSIFTFRTFSASIHAQATTQRGSHGQVVQLAQEHAGSKLDIPTHEDVDPSNNGASNYSQSSQSSQTQPTSVMGTPQADMDEIKDYIDDYMRNVTRSTALQLNGFVEGAKQRIQGTLQHFADEINLRMNSIRDSALQLQYDSDDENEYTPIHIQDLSDGNQLEQAANRLNISMNRYGGLRHDDWALVLSVIHTLAKRTDKTKNEGGGLDFELPRLRGRLPWGALLGTILRLAPSAAAMTVLQPGAIPYDRMSPEDRAQYDSDTELQIQHHLARDERIRNGTASLWDRFTHSTTDHEHDDILRLAPSERRRRFEELYQNSTRPPPPTTERVIEREIERREKSITAESRQRKTFERRSKFADLGLNLEDHSSVGG